MGSLYSKIIDVQVQRVQEWGKKKVYLHMKKGVQVEMALKVFRRISIGEDFRQETIWMIDQPLDTQR